MTGELTGRQLCAAAQTRLAAAGVPDAARDVALLYHHALNIGLDAPVPRHHLSLHLGQVPDPVVARAFDAAIAAREARRPVSQITGKRSFWRHEFTVTADTLDPRPETETLVAAALGLPWNSVLDLGTGTGAILISLLSERPGTTGTGTDLSPAALDVARGNAARIGVTADWRQADWFAGLSGRRFDLIVSNPPYIALAEMPDLSPEVRDWEPHSALTDGGDGLSAYRSIAAGAQAHLTPGGHVLVEIGAAQGGDVSAIFAAAGAQVTVIPDLDGRNRVVSARFSP